MHQTDKHHQSPYQMSRRSKKTDGQAERPIGDEVRALPIGSNDGSMTPGMMPRTPANIVDVSCSPEIRTKRGWLLYEFEEDDRKRIELDYVWILFAWLQSIS